MTGTLGTTGMGKTDPRRRRVAVLAVAAVTVAAAMALAWKHGLGEWLGGLRWADVQEAVRGAGAWGPGICIALLAVCTVAFLATTPVVVLAGLLYGLPAALAICWAGLGTGMALAFWLSRTLLRERLERRYAGHPLYLRLRGPLEREGWKVVFFMRMLPVNPYPLLNYLFGLSPIRFRAYMLASLAGVVPNILFLLLASRAAGDVAADGFNARAAAMMGGAALLFLALCLLPKLAARRARGRAGTAGAVASAAENSEERADGLVDGGGPDGAAGFGRG